MKNGQFDSPALWNLNSQRIRRLIERRLRAATIDARYAWIKAVEAARPIDEQKAHDLLTKNLTELTTGKRV